MCALFSDPWTGSALLLHSPSSKLFGAFPRGSAISISRNWVLTHGTTLEPITSTCKATSDFMANIVPGQLTSVPQNLAKNMKFSVLRELNKNIEWHIGQVAFAWICPLVTQTFEIFCSTWSFHERNTFKLQELPRALFLLIHVDFDHSYAKISSAEEALRSLQDQTSSQNFTRGTPVKIISSPFGNTWLINSIAQGIVSNVIGGIIMTDAYVFPKSEGGPVYMISPDSGSKSLIGMVIVTMIWCRNEWVHYTFAANLAPCLSAILQKMNSVTPINLAIRHDSQNVLDRSVVVVTCGYSKGTGIFVDKDNGIFLTCSHVVEEAAEMEISVMIFKDDENNAYSRMPAKLLFNNPTTLPYDVAILKVETSKLDPSLEPVQFSDVPIEQGEPVVAVGFALFLSTRSTISSGVVAKSLDYMLLTTCCIQSGFSGGPIISRTTGRMLGMIISNVQSMDNSAYYQRMSMSVPVAVLSKPLRQYLLTDNVDALQSLINDDPIVQKAWTLEYHLSSKL